jgi:prepilin-type N-terminal cleavage/methylation domain-containing protein
MIPLRTWLQNQHGFTLAELLVAAAVTGLVMAGVFVVQRGGQQAYLLGSNRVETQQNARVALDLMTRELRSARSITTIASCTSDVCTDLTFVDQNANSIQYCWSSRLTACDSTGQRSYLGRNLNGTYTVLIGGAQSLAMTSYKVYDVSAATYTKTIIPAEVKVINISVTAKTEESVAAYSAGDQRATMESTVQLRLNLS